MRPTTGTSGTGDFNGDGLTTSSGGRTTARSHLLIERRPIIGGPTFGGIGNDWHIEGVGDTNGDGKDDIIWRNDNGTVATWR